jgi:hypothetical protein
MRPVFSKSTSSASRAPRFWGSTGEDLFVGLDGAIVVAEAALPQLADLQAQLDALLGVVDDLGLAREHLDEAIPRLRAAVEPLERRDGVDAAFVGVEGALVGERRLRRVADLRLVGVGELEEDVDARRRLLLDLGVTREGRDELAPPLLLAEELLERLQRARRGRCRAGGPAAPTRWRSRCGGAPSRTSGRS